MITSTSDYNQASFGQNGMYQLVQDRAIDGQIYSIQATSESVITVVSEIGDGLTNQLVPVGSVINGRFSMVYCVSGSVICYNSPINNSILTPYTPPDPSIQAGYDWLEANAKAAWDFTNMAGIGFGDAPDTVADFTGNGYTASDLSNVLSPKIGAYINRNNEVKTYLKALSQPTPKSGYSIALPSTNLFNSDFEVHLTAAWGDGRLAENSVWGVNGGAARRIYMRKTATGFFEININVSGTSWPIFTTTTGQLDDLLTDPVYIRFRVDFTTDTFTFYLNGIQQTVSVGGTGPLSGQNPASFNGVYGFGIGVEQSGATTFTNWTGSSQSVFKHAITPLLTNAADVNNVAAWMTNI